MEICHITTAHNPDDIRIFHKQCKSLSTFGFKVTILSMKASKIIDKDIEFISLNTIDNSSKRNFKNLNRLYKKALELDADVYQAHDPDLLFVLYRLRQKGKKVIFDFHEDIYEQIKSKTYLPHYLRGFTAYFYRVVERVMIRKLNAVITATDTIREKYSHLKVPVVTIKNYPLLSEMDLLKKSKTKRENILYIGGLSKGRGTFDLIRIASERPNYTFVVAGKFYSKDDEQRFIEESPENIIFKGYIGRNEIINELGNAAIGLVLLEDIERYKVSLPIKIFEYMGAAIPVISNDFPLWKKIIDENKAGYTVHRNDMNEILSKIDSLMNDEELSSFMGENGRNLVYSELNWNVEEKKLTKLYKSI